MTNLWLQRWTSLKNWYTFDFKGGPLINNWKTIDINCFASKNNCLPLNQFFKPLTRSTLQHSLVSADWFVSVYLANLICVCFPGQPNHQFHFTCVPFYMRLHYVTCLRSNWRITYGKISPERIIHCLSVINVLFSTFW